ncbi:hypothetical protein RFI_05220 [Reticulomyxa filosa]|uniref:Uncharacterized protein n=1 Tax=Reticulomyxa filosa TaxID=46433 RepID=X6P117_RETFI|nr:hypothetical protein RFI_05220 [Reticulomyxa filosa]|eukprot:ETO31896.1 hypothetical protein RFI_05220 [Reticulomyxa filosa]
MEAPKQYTHRKLQKNNVQENNSRNPIPKKKLKESFELSILDDNKKRLESIYINTLKWAIKCFISSIIFISNVKNESGPVEKFSYCPLCRRRVLLVNDPRFVDTNIATYLMTTLRIAGFTIELCRHIPTKPDTWSIEQKEAKEKEKKKEEKEEEGLFSNSEISWFEQSKTGYDCILIPPQTNGSLWSELSADSQMNLFHFVHRHGKVIVLLHFHGCEIANGILQLERESKDTLTANMVQTTDNKTNDDSSIARTTTPITPTHNDDAMLWHETSVRLGPSQINTIAPKTRILKNIYCPETISDVYKQCHTLNAPILTSRAPRMLPAVNCVLGMLRVPNDCVCFKTNDDFTTVAVKQIGNGSIAVLGHDFSEILIKDWNRVLFLALRQQLVLKNGEEPNLLSLDHVNIDAIKRLNIASTSTHNDFDVQFDDETTESTFPVEENSAHVSNPSGHTNSAPSGTHSINFDEFDIALENDVSDDILPNCMLSISLVEVVRDIYLLCVCFLKASQGLTENEKPSSDANQNDKTSQHTNDTTEDINKS